MTALLHELPTEAPAARHDEAAPRGVALWVPRLLIATAVVHVAYAFAVPNTWGGIAGDGFLDALAGHDALTEAERRADLWFLLAGPSMLAIGLLARSTARATGRLPAHLGGSLLLIAVPMTVVDPRSGGWLLGALGAVTLAAARRRRRRPRRA